MTPEETYDHIRRDHHKQASLAGVERVHQWLHRNQPCDHQHETAPGQVPSDDVLLPREVVERLLAFCAMSAEHPRVAPGNQHKAADLCSILTEALTTPARESS